MSYHEEPPLKRCSDKCMAHSIQSKGGCKRHKLVDISVSEQYSRQNGAREPQTSEFALGDWVKFTALHKEYTGQIWAHEYKDWWWVADGRRFHHVCEDDMIATQAPAA